MSGEDDVKAAPSKADALSKPQLEEALWTNVKNGKAKELQQFFVEQKEHPNLADVIKTPYEDYDEDGGHVLIYCVKEGRDKGSVFGGKDYGSCITILVENGVDINFTDKGLKSALSWAVTSKYPNYVSKLMKLGADPNVLDQDGYSPFHLAIQLGYKDICSSIIEASPQVRVEQHAKFVTFNGKSREISFYSNPIWCMYMF